MLAQKQYELSNHLGNVLATVLDRRTMTSDKVLAYATNFTGTLDGWTAGWSAAGTLYNVTPPTTVSLDNNRLQCTATTSMGGVRNVINTSVGVSYTLTLDIDMGTAEGLYIMPRASNGGNIYTGTNLAQVYVTSSGTYSVNFTASTTTTQLLVEKAGAVVQTFYVDNVKVEQSTPTLSSYPIADVVNAQYYYPFGSAMKTWKADGEDYRFGFSGMENDNEAKGDGNSYTTEFRQYDPRIGRWLSPDPLMAQFPSWSPYVYAFDNPILMNDPDGDAPPTIKEIIATGKKSSTTFVALMKSSGITDANYSSNISFGNGTYTENKTGKIVLTKSSDIKFQVIKLTHEMTNRKNIKVIQATDKKVAEGKITAKEYAKQLAQIEVEGQINQVKVAAEIGYRYEGKQAEGINKLIDAYSKDKTIDLSKYIKASNEHLKTYEKQGEELREEQKKKDAEKKETKTE